MQTLIFRNKETPRLIFGSLTIAPLQRNLTPEAGGRVIAAALQKGLRWIDTAQMYGSYPHVRRGIELSGINRDRLILSTKSTCTGYAEMQAAIKEALQALDCDCLDLFLLHAVRSVEDYRNRSGALQALLDARQAGQIGAVGISTHSIRCARELAEDHRLEWFHLIFNRQGIGLTDGTLEDQIAVLEKIKRRGARVYAMKPLGGGYLGKTAREALSWIKDHPLVDAVALGMASEDEVEMNINLFSGKPVPAPLQERLGKAEKTLFVFKPICTGCGKCAAACEQSAIHVVENTAQVAKEKCILCGYCVPVCPAFALRII